MLEDKADAPLLMVMSSWRNQGIEAMRRHIALWGVTLRDGKVLLQMSVCCSEDLGGDPRWKGMIASHRFEGTQSAMVPVELVEELAAHPAVSRMQLARRHRFPERRRRH